MKVPLDKVLDLVRVLHLEAHSDVAIHRESDNSREKLLKRDLLLVVVHKDGQIESVLHIGHHRVTEDVTLAYEWEDGLLEAPCKPKRLPLGQICDCLIQSDRPILYPAQIILPCDSIERVERDQRVEVELASTVLDEAVSYCKWNPLRKVGIVTIICDHILPMELHGVINDKQDINNLLAIALLVVSLLKDGTSVANRALDVLSWEVAIYEGFQK